MKRAATALLLLAIILGGCSQPSPSPTNRISFSQAWEKLAPEQRGQLVEAQTSTTLDGATPSGLASYWNFRVIVGNTTRFIQVDADGARLVGQGPISQKACAAQPKTDTTELAAALASSPYWKALLEPADEPVTWSFSCLLEGPHWSFTLPPPVGSRSTGEFLLTPEGRVAGLRGRYAGNGPQLMTNNGLNVQGGFAYAPAGTTGDGNMSVRLQGVTDVAVVVAPGMYPYRSSGLFTGNIVVIDPAGHATRIPFPSLGQAGDATYINGTVAPDAMTGRWQVRYHIDEPLPGLGAYIDVCTGMQHGDIGANTACEALQNAGF